MSSRQLFIDLDGVLADFFGYYETCFGIRAAPDDNTPDFWNNIRRHKNFYRDQPLMPDAMELWEGVKQFDPSPIILTGIPFSIPNVVEHKQQWVKKYLGPFVGVICCRSKDKCVYGNIGDILVDDRIKYREYWDDMGGIFVVHTSAQDTLAQLKALYTLA